MTSKSLFFKLIKQDFQKRLWCPILIFIGYFLILEVRLLMMLGKIADRAYTDYYADAADYVQRGFFGDDLSLHVIIVCFAAFLCALSGFSYLHSKKQLDAYHSLPVNRTQLFLAKYVSGFLWFAVPFVFHILVCMGICAGRDALTGRALINALGLMGVPVLMFLLMYGAFIMAVCLTGNLIISMLASAAVFCYSTIAALLLEGMFSAFFDTYVSIEGNTVWERFWAFSPLSMLIKFFDEWTSSVGAGYLWAIAAGAAVYTLTAYALYRKRASEAAGKAIAFPWAEPVLKTLLVVPASFYSGIFFSELAGEDYYDGPWYWFGIIFGYLICALLIEIVFRLDVKGALCHKKQLLFNAACVALIFVIFQFDALGYDTYVPGESGLTDCSVSIEGLMETSPIIPYYGSSMISYSAMNTDEYRMENVAVMDNPSVFALAKKAAAEELSFHDLPEDAAGEYRYILFGFHRKGGKTVYRQYLVDISDEETLALIADIFNDEAYKAGTNVLINEGDKQEFTKLYCVGNFAEMYLDMTQAFQKQLWEAYREEFMALDFYEIQNTCPVGGIAFLTEEIYEYMEKRGSDYYLNHAMGLIYPQFTKTIALLKENGFDVYTEPAYEDISYVDVMCYYYEKSEDGEEAVSRKLVEIEIYDREQQEEILGSAEASLLRQQISSYTDFVDGDFLAKIYMRVLSSDGTSRITSWRTYYLRKGEIPTFIYESEEYLEAVTE